MPRPSSSSNMRLTRRALVGGSVALAVFGRGGARAPARAADGPIVWMSNQRHDQEVKEELFAAYQKQTGIAVDLQIYGDEYPDQLKLAFTSGQPPDIYRMVSPAEEVAAGWPEPLDDYLAAAPGLKETFLLGSFVPNRGIWGGRTYGLPMYAPTMRYYYNRALFERAGLDPNAPPATFSAFRQAAKQITDALRGEGAYGLILGDKYTWVWWMNGECFGNAAGAYAFDWRQGRYAYTSEGLKEALRLTIAMQKDGSLFPGYHALTDDDARQQFALGRAGIVVGGSWNIGVFVDEMKTTQPWDVAELPRPDGGALGRVQQTIGDRYTITAASPRKETAWRVLQYIYSPDVMRTMHERGMGVMAVAAANSGRSQIPGVAKVAPTPGDLVIPPEPELPTLSADPFTVMQQVVDEGGATMDRLLGDLDRAYNDALDQAVARGDLRREDFTISDFDPLTWQPRNG